VGQRTILKTFIGNKASSRRIRRASEVTFYYYYLLEKENWTEKPRRSSRSISIPVTCCLVFITLTEPFHSKQEYSTGRLLHLAHKSVLSAGNPKIIPLNSLFSSQKERKREEREKKRKRDVYLPDRKV